MRFLISRLQRLVLVLFAVSAVTFFLVNVLPGDIAWSMVGLDATEEAARQIREDMGLHKPVVVRYFNWLGGMLTGDWGTSWRTEEPVLEAILSRLPVTLELMALAQLMALGLALPAGIACAWYAGRPFDKIMATLGFFSLSLPVFMSGVVLIYFFSLYLDWFPATGFTPISEGLLANLRSLFLPALGIALAEWTVLMRVLRADLIGVLQEDYITNARAKGLSTLRIVFVHALRPASFSLITILGLQVAYLVGGSLLTETIFALPGIGRYLISAIYARDYAVIQGVVTLIALGYVLINFLVDLAYSALDPRVRSEAGND
jgi:peptide/nickel transport system permease protein